MFVVFVCGSGLVVIVVGVFVLLFWLFLVGGFVVGVGVGVLFKCVFVIVLEVVEFGWWGEMFVVIFFVVYCGLVILVFVIGVVLMVIL